ncbi:MAG: methionyl-tRNA formyltransferase, partial [Nocardioidaceae bacterium]
FVDRRIRACTPAPGAWTTYAGQRLKLGPVSPDPEHPVLPPGELAVTKRTVHVGTRTTPVRLGEVTPVGKKPMGAAEWARGVRLETGARLGDETHDR